MMLTFRSRLAVAFGFLTIAGAAFAQADRLSSEITTLNNRGTPLTPREATRRAGLLRELIAADPARALQLAALEQRTDFTGIPEATVEDDFERHSTRTRWVLRTPSGETVELHFATGARPQDCTREIRVTGIRVEDRIAAAAFASEGPANLTSSQCSTTTGVRRIAVLLLQTPSATLPASVTSAALTTAFFGTTGQSVNTFWAEASYGKTSATGSVFGPFTLSSNFTCNQTESILTAAIAAAQASVDFTQYHHLVLVMPNVGSCSIGFGSIGCRQLNSTQRGTFSTAVSWLRADYLNRTDAIVSVAGHELGHNLRLDHSNTLNFAGIALGPPGTGSSNEYQDYLAMMGLSYTFNGRTLLGHYAAPHKSRMGWFNPGNLQNVETSGTYTIAPYESPASGPQVLRVRRGAGSDAWLWIEYRRNAGFDATLAPIVPSFDGALIHYEDPLLPYDPTYTHLLNFHPGGALGRSFLLNGESWTDPSSTLRLRVDGATSAGLTVTVTLGTPTPSSGLQFVPVTPCRVADTRNTDGPLGGPAIATTRNFPIPSSSCGIHPGAQAYSLNVTVVPRGTLGYLSIWPAGQTQPTVSTLNSLDGRVKANAAIVPAGASGAVSVFVTNTTDVILDINGYFIPSDPNGLAFYPITPCRVSDTRAATGSLGGPFLAGNNTRVLPVLSAGCGIPSSAKAYSLNATVVPKTTLGYLSMWPAGSSLPLVSTLNATTGTVVANAAIVPAGTGGSINVYATNNTDLILDVNGYFAPPGSTGELKFYPLTPCRISDTRTSAGTFGGPPQSAQATRDYPLPQSSCGIPTAAKAYSLSATVVPPLPFGFLTLWPTGAARPTVSTLNAIDGAIASNAAIVPAGTNGSISAYGSDLFHLLLDINGYFAP
jgi:M6 family metalloprotease-like protein